MLVGMKILIKIPTSIIIESNKGKSFIRNNR